MRVPARRSLPRALRRGRAGSGCWMRCEAMRDAHVVFACSTSPVEICGLSGSLPRHGSLGRWRPSPLTHVTSWRWLTMCLGLRCAISISMWSRRFRGRRDLPLLWKPQTATSAHVLGSCITCRCPSNACGSLRRSSSVPVLAGSWRCRFGSSPRASACCVRRRRLRPSLRMRWVLTTLERGITCWVGKTAPTW